MRLETQFWKNEGRTRENSEIGNSGKKISENDFGKLVKSARHHSKDNREISCAGLTESKTPRAVGKEQCIERIPEENEAYTFYILF